MPAGKRTGPAHSNRAENVPTLDGGMESELAIEVNAYVDTVAALLDVARTENGPHHLAMSRSSRNQCTLLCSGLQPRQQV